jgi:mono/diheme cytochrome c family protein
MLASARTVPPAEFDSWVSAQLSAGGELGKQTFDGSCGPCHGLRGEGIIGPPLAGNSTLADDELLRQLLENGKNAMPPVGRGWDERQTNALIQYAQREFASGN